MVVSELNRRLAGLKVTVCLVLPWLRPNHNVAPGNRMSPWNCANVRICASPTSNQELKNVCVCVLSLFFSQSLPTSLLYRFLSYFIHQYAADCLCSLFSPFFLPSIRFDQQLQKVTIENCIAKHNTIRKAILFEKLNLLQCPSELLDQKPIASIE